MLDVPLNAMWKNCEQEQTRTGKDQIESYDLLQTNTIHEEGSTQTRNHQTQKEAVVDSFAPAIYQFLSTCKAAFAHMLGSALM